MSASGCVLEREKCIGNVRRDDHIGEERMLGCVDMGAAGMLYCAVCGGRGGGKGVAVDGSGGGYMMTLVCW